MDLLYMPIRYWNNDTYEDDIFITHAKYETYKL